MGYFFKLFHYLILVGKEKESTNKLVNGNLAIKYCIIFSFSNIKSEVK